MELLRKKINKVIIYSFVSELILDWPDIRDYTPDCESLQRKCTEKINS